jgi:phosphoglucomutase
MAIHPLAGKPAPEEILINVGELERAYYERVPDISNPHERVSFGTSGHRGSPFDGTLNASDL